MDIQLVERFADLYFSALDGLRESLSKIQGATSKDYDLDSNSRAAVNSASAVGIHPPPVVSLPTFSGDFEECPSNRVNDN